MGQELLSRSLCSGKKVDEGSGQLGAPLLNRLSHAPLQMALMEVFKVCVWERRAEERGQVAMPVWGKAKGWHH